MKYCILGIWTLYAVFSFSSVCSAQGAKTENRFQIIYEQTDRLSYIQILVDTETGMKYLFCKYGYGAALTPLLGETSLPTGRAEQTEPEASQPTTYEYPPPQQPTPPDEETENKS